MTERDARRPSVVFEGPADRFTNGFDGGVPRKDVDERRAEMLAVGVAGREGGFPRNRSSHSTSSSESPTRDRPVRPVGFSFEARFLTVPTPRLMETKIGLLGLCLFLDDGSSRLSFEITRLNLVGVLKKTEEARVLSGRQETLIETRKGQ